MHKEVSMSEQKKWLWICCFFGVAFSALTVLNAVFGVAAFLQHRYIEAGLDALLVAAGSYMVRSVIIEFARYR